MGIFQITDIKMIAAPVISLLWIFLGMLLYALSGVKHGPKGGIDKIADALVYVFIWRLFIFAPPVLITAVTFFLWLIQNHKGLIPYVVVFIIALFLLVMLYKKHIKKIILTPDRVAAGIDTYETWAGRNNRNLPEGYTEYDLICKYISFVTSEALDEYRSLYSEDDISLRTAYINAALKAHYHELPQVVGWEYFPDIRKHIPARSYGDERFLLSNSDFRCIADRYQRTLNRSHWYDRYQFSSSAIAEWYSWLPMLAIFYNDGSMDMIIAS